MEGNVRKVLSGVGFYGTLAVCLAIVGVCGWLLLSGGEEPAGQTQVTPQIPVSQPVEMPEKTVEQPVETLKPEPAVQEAASEPRRPIRPGRGRSAAAHCGTAARRGADGLFHGGAGV